MKKITVKLDGHRDDSYEIHIGEGILDRIGMAFGKDDCSMRCIIITDRAIDALHGERVQTALEKSGLRIDRIVLPPGEETKVMSTVLSLSERLNALGADRKTVLLALGGGVIGDLTGFTASIYMRGIPFLQLPTTLLAQVDSSIGGKTGVDTPFGKNMLGTFCQPKGVFIDTDFLQTLPEDTFRSGFAEVIKYGAIENPALLDDLENAAGEDRLRETSFLQKIIMSSCLIKKNVVELDEHEHGLRRILNFGHTVGHAVEASSGYSLSHGEAVAVGMMAAGRLSERLYGLPREEKERITAAIRSVGLPQRIPAGMEIEDILDRLSADKKKEGGTIHFAMIRSLGKPFITGGIKEETLKETLEELKE